jgi:hypothetical protein
MSSPPGRAADPEAAYYQAVEEFFVSRRGDPLFISNADWLLVRRWRSEGIPLRIVLRGIADALESHAHSWSRDRKVGSLAYCAAEVEAARERWQRALSLGEEEGVDAREALAGFASALESARGLGRRGAAAARALAAALRERAAGGLDVAELEPWLAGREAELVDALREDAGTAALSAIEAAVDADLAPYRERIPARILAQVRRDSIVHRLLERHGLVRLSLFHL